MTIVRAKSCLDRSKYRTCLNERPSITTNDHTSRLQGGHVAVSCVADAQVKYGSTERALCTVNGPQADYSDLESFVIYRL